MKIKPGYRYPVVVCVWDDAESDSDWVQEPIHPLEGTAMLTMGFLVRDEPNYILVADSYEMKEGSKLISNTTKIPRAKIKELRHVKIVEPRKENKNNAPITDSSSSIARNLCSSES